MKKNDLILLCVIVAVSLVTLLILYACLGDRGQTVVVTVNGEERYRLPLNEDTQLWIEGHGGGGNRLIIENKIAYIQEASCPDKVCVHTGSADELKSIVCAPNRVTVSIEP